MKNLAIEKQQLVEVLAKKIADKIGHGMREKCICQATTAVEMFWPLVTEAQGIVNDGINEAVNGELFAYEELLLDPLSKLQSA